MTGRFRWTTRALTLRRRAPALPTAAGAVMVLPAKVASILEPEGPEA
jgi:hypothetical protein